MNVNAGEASMYAVITGGHAEVDHRKQAVRVRQGVPGRITVITHGLAKIHKKGDTPLADALNSRQSVGRGLLLAAIGICPFAAMGGCPETASFVTECDQGLGRGRAGSRYWVRPGGDAVGARSTQMEKSVLGPRRRRLPDLPN